VATFPGERDSHAERVKMPRKRRNGGDAFGVFVGKTVMAPALLKSL
jgi:hypothetical protein